MKEFRETLYTYSGVAAFPIGAPTLLDIAVGLSREGRFAGQGVRWFPVVLHSFVVADLLPPRLKLHGLLHDCDECLTGDLPKPFKTPTFEKLEEKIRKLIYRSQKLPYPTPEQHAIIKEADQKSLQGEVYTVGTRALQLAYDRCPEAEELVLRYLADFPPTECLHSDGKAVVEFLRRYHLYRGFLEETNAN
jgi:hypothetical protein